MLEASGNSSKVLNQINNNLPPRGMLENVRHTKTIYSESPTGGHNKN